MPEVSSLRPKVTDYSDYHLYLRDFYDFKKAQSRHFSFRKFAQLAEIKSSNYLMLVMNRQRNLLPETAVAVAKAIRLSKNETDLFVALVKYERAKTEEERARIEGERKLALKKILGKELPLEKAEYLREWYYPIVRELAFLPDFKDDPKWIAQKLKGLITEAQAENAARVLVSLGLWKMAKGRVVVSDLLLDTGSEERSYADINVTRIHQQNLMAWARSIESIPKAERELGLINIPIDEANIPELKSRIQKFQDEIVSWLQDEKKPTQIVQLGTYLVPLTPPTGGQKEKSREK
jgi:uncharacterized protein (TIGR02147 family)